MTQFSRICTLAVVAALSLGLAACSSEPSNEDMRKALQRNPNIHFALQGLIGLTAHNPAMPRIGNRPRKSANAPKSVEAYLRDATIKKAACASAQGAPGYVCDFSIGGKDTPNPSIPMRGRFFKADDGWYVQMVR